MFQAKYGKDFVMAADELRPDCGVSRLVSGHEAWLRSEHAGDWPCTEPQPSTLSKSLCTFGDWAHVL